MTRRASNLEIGIAAFAVAFVFVAVLKFHDVSIVRRAVPDLGFFEALFWPVDEARDAILYCGSPRDPDCETCEAVRKWVEARRRGESLEIDR